MNKEKDLKEFENESEKIKSIVYNRTSGYWEFLLAFNLLESRLADISKKYETLNSGIQGKRISINDDLSFIDWGIANNNKLSEIINDLSNAICKDLKKAFGPIGKHGDAVQIKIVVDRITLLCEKFITMETEIRLIDPPHRYYKLLKLMEGVTTGHFNTILQWNDKLKFVVLDQASPNPKGKYDLSIPWTTSPQDELMQKENDKITEELKRSQINTKSYSYSSRELSGELYNGSAKSKRKNRTRTNIRQTVGLIGKLIRIFK